MKPTDLERRIPHSISIGMLVWYISHFLFRSVFIDFLVGQISDAR